MDKSVNTPGMLMLCATPIGNLNDMSPRILETLQTADLIAAEDTRNSIKLLNHFDIHTPMTSYHEYNRTEKAAELIERMKKGENIALITDAGMPAVSDPGEVLVKMCHDEGITVTALPGPCACVTALALSGLPTRRFVFEGFLPDDKKERRQVLEELASEKRTIILYCPPHDLKKVLRVLLENLGDRKIAICRELTKKFEQVLKFTVDEALAYYEENQPKGEFVLVVEGKDAKALHDEQVRKFLDMDVSEHVKMYEDRGYDRKEAMKLAAKDRGVTRRDIYNELL